MCLGFRWPLTDAQELKTLDNPTAAINAVQESSSEFSDAVDSGPDEVELAEVERDKPDAPMVPLIDERKSHFAEIPPMLRVPGVSILDIQRTMALSAELGGVNPLRLGVFFGRCIVAVCVCSWLCRAVGVPRLRGLIHLFRKCDKK